MFLPHCLKLWSSELSNFLPILTFSYSLFLLYRKIRWKFLDSKMPSYLKLMRMPASTCPSTIKDLSTILSMVSPLNYALPPILSCLPQEVVPTSLLFSLIKFLPLLTRSHQKMTHYASLWKATLFWHTSFLFTCLVRRSSFILYKRRIVYSVPISSSQLLFYFQKNLLN